MKDVMRILNMKQPQVPNGSLVFSAPLYRKYTREFFFFNHHVGPNLIYSVVQKPNSAEETIQQMTHWILSKYPNESGIIYCLSKKETESVAQMIYKESQGKIKCGAYHADMDDVREREREPIENQDAYFIIIRRIKNMFIKSGEKKKFK